MSKNVFIILSFIVGMLCINYIRSFDKHEKEPFLKLVAVTCWGGVWSIIIALTLYKYLFSLGITDIHNSFGALFIIGPVEELAKLLAFLSCYYLIKNELNEPVDGLIYMGCVALGFSLIENYNYAIRASDPGYLFFLRLFITTPTHVTESVFMGLAFYVCLKNKHALWFIIIAYLYASFVHGLFDLVAFNELILGFLMAVIGLSIYWAKSLLSYTTALSPFRKTLSEFVNDYKKPMLAKGVKCLKCGSENKKTTYQQASFFIQKCDSCENYVTTRKGIYLLFHHFAATFKVINEENEITPIDTEGYYSTIVSNNYISEKEGIAYFNLKELSETIEKTNAMIIRKMEEKWWIPKDILKPSPIEINK